MTKKKKRMDYESLFEAAIILYTDKKWYSELEQILLVIRNYVELGASRTFTDLAFVDFLVFRRRHQQSQDEIEQMICIR